MRLIVKCVSSGCGHTEVFNEYDNPVDYCVKCNNQVSRCLVSEKIYDLMLEIEEKMQKKVEEL